MNKKRLASSILCGALGIALLTPTAVHAEDFSGREAEMNEKCAAIYDENTQAECSAYKDYLNTKASEMESTVDALKNQIAAVKGDISKVSEQISANNKQINEANADLESIQASIDETNANIKTLNTQIEETKASIKLRDEQMKERLVEMQPYIGSNNFIDFLMGASSFTDLLRRASIINELNTYEQQMIATLNEEKKALENKQQDVETKQELLKAQEKSATAKKAVAESYKSANEELLVYYQEQESTLAEEKRRAQVESGEFASSIPNIDLSIIPSDWGDDSSDSGNSDSGNTDSGNTDSGNSGNTGDDGNSGNSGSSGGSGNTPALSNGWMIPVQGKCYVSAGTWAYPGGGEHLGMDFGTYNQVGLSVVAPASGIVVAINDGVANHGVYESGIGSWTGYPSGGGNTLHMIVQVKGVAYGISFYHLSPGMFNVSVGDIVSQGQLMAHTGHSGNSSGPHCHVEVTRLGNISISQGVQVFYNYGKDYFYGNYNANGRCDIKGSTPCLERPENFFS